MKTKNTPTIELPSFSPYCNYSSDNYGAHCLRFSLPGLTVWFSYQTPVAFDTPATGRVVRQNDWSVTTGKHLNAIDGGDKKSRVTAEEFERRLAEACGKSL